MIPTLVPFRSLMTYDLYPVSLGSPLLSMLELRMSTSLDMLVIKD